MTRGILRAVRLVALLGPVAWTGLLGAQTDQARAGARSAAEQGANAFDEGRYRDALEYMQRAESLVHAQAHLLYIARSHAALGQLVAAREVYLRLSNEVLPQNAHPVALEAQEAGRAELAAIEERIPLLTVRLGGSSSDQVGTKVTMDGEELPLALLGVPTPVDPGVHRVRVSAPGNADVSEEVVLTEGARETVELKLVPLGVAGGAPAGAPAASEVDQGAGSSRSLWGYILSSGGVGLLGAGATFGVLAKSQRDDAREDRALCPNSVCSPDGRAEIDSARTKARLATVTTGVGLVALGTGLYLLLTGQESAGAVETQLSSELGLEGGYVSYRGAF